MDTTTPHYTIERYDFSKDQSLRAWSAADEYLLAHFSDAGKTPKLLTIYNDRFGYLACHLHAYSPTVIITQQSQQKAVDTNLEANGLAPLPYAHALSSFKRKMDVALIKIPKSMDLFRLILEQIVHNSLKEVSVICSFMTRHFSPRLVEIASEYFEVTEQSKAHKKARLLILSKKKKTIKKDCTHTLIYKDQEYQQYWGVFSAQHIDYATQFFIENMIIKDTDTLILDLASGNGVIAKEIQKINPKAELHLLDDTLLAVASAKLNISGSNVHHHNDNDLDAFKDEFFDLIVTNPPFHVEYEINIQIPIQLFKEAYRCLKPGGNLQVVANKHLNYKTHLEPLFRTVAVVAEDAKFLIYMCTK